MNFSCRVACFSYSVVEGRGSDCEFSVSELSRLRDHFLDLCLELLNDFIDFGIRVLVVAGVWQDELNSHLGQIWMLLCSKSLESGRSVGANENSSGSSDRCGCLNDAVEKINLLL